MKMIEGLDDCLEDLFKHYEKDGITANADSSLLFSRFLNLRTIEGLEYFELKGHFFDMCRY